MGGDVNERGAARPLPRRESTRRRRGGTVPAGKRPQEADMTTDVANVVDTYLAAWNETDADRRRELIAQTWTDDASYVDPHMAGEGPDGIDAMVAAVQERF